MHLHKTDYPNPVCETVSVGKRTQEKSAQGKRAQVKN